MTRKRSDTADAARRRANRAKERDGLVFLRLWVDRRRLTKAIQRARGGLSNHATKAEITAATVLVVLDFLDRWVPRSSRARM
jgi:hypothetical protein